METQAREQDDSALRRKEPIHDVEQGHSAHDGRTQPIMPFMPAFLATANTSGRGSHEVRSASFLDAQRAYGNRAVQRYVNRAQRSPVPVQRAPSAPPPAPSKKDNLWDYMPKVDPKEIEYLDQWMKKAHGEVAFDNLFNIGSNVKNAPENLRLPQVLQDGLAKAWKGSFPGDKSQEQGGILAKDAHDKYVWHEGKALPLDKGGSGAFSPDYSTVGKDETMVGVAHTHPYSKAEGGHTNVSFSGQDLARYVYVDDKIQVMQSGEGQFATARTEEFDKKLKGLDDKGKRKLYDDMNKDYDAILKNPKDKRPLPERARDATMAVTKKYNLLYYEGKGGDLEKR